MRIRINQGAGTSPVPGAKLGEVLDGLRRDAWSRGQVLTGLFLDGEVLTPELEESAAARPAEEFQVLDVEVGPPQQLLQEVLGGIERALGAFNEKAAGAGGRIRRGEPAGPFVEALTEELAFVLEAYGEALRLLDAIGMPPAGAGGGTQPLETVLNEILSGLVSQDVVRIGDALEHELGPALEAFAVEVRTLSGSLGGGAADEGESAPPAGERR